MTYELTEQEKHDIDAKSRAFWADLKVKVYKNAVIFYVKSHRSNFDYPWCMGLYENPQEVLEAVLVYPGYVKRASVSGTTGLAALMMMYNQYDGNTPQQIDQLCDDAIAYWHKQQQISWHKGADTAMGSEVLR